MKKTNFFQDNKEIAYQLCREDKISKFFEILSDEEKEVFGAASAEEYQETCLDLLDSVGAVCGSQLDTNAPFVDREDLKLVDGKVILPESIEKNIATLLELGAHSLCAPIKYGGMAAPLFLELAGSEMVARSCPSTLLSVSWYSSIANIISLFGSEQLQEEYIPRITSGELSGSMALTEPDVGSDLASMRTYGELQEDGSWLVTGEKIFISNGCGGISLVLAQNEKGAQGLKSLSLFLIPQEVDKKSNFSITKIEEKPALHGSATCALKFDRSKAWLIGDNGCGFKYMAYLMNEARIAVAYQGLGIMEASWRLANSYAEQRKSWGKPISQHEMIAEKLLDMETEITAFRSLLYKACFYSSMVHTMELRLKDQALPFDKMSRIQAELPHYKRKLREWTPLLKWWAGERSYEFARNCVQIHGGYGFTKEYRAEFWVRESLIVSIYEGTSEIQALMSIKDTIKGLIKHPRQFSESLIKTRMKILAEREPIKRKYLKMKLSYLNSILILVLKLLKENVKEGYLETKASDIVGLLKKLKDKTKNFDHISPALLNASRLTEMATIVAMGRSLVGEMQKDGRRKQYALRFMNRWYPTIQKIKMEIEWDDQQVACKVDDDENTFAMAEEA